MYHAIGRASNGEIGADLYSVSANNFREQMQYLVSCGMDNFIITFDDGDVTNYQYAYPILKGLGLSAYFFVIVSKIGQAGYMNWQQLEELQEGGMVIGSHGMTHKILTELNDRELGHEFRASKTTLEYNLKRQIDYFSVPRGFCNEQVAAKAKECGYKSVFASNIDVNGYTFGRIAVKRDWDIKYFKQVLNGFSLRHKAEELIKKSSKRILGTKHYDRLRSRLLKE